MTQHFGGAVVHWAARYDVLVWLLSLGRVNRMYGRLLAPAHLRAGESVLDVGCGTGSLVRVARQQVGTTGRVAGIDASPAMIARARKKVPDARFEVAFAQSLPFADAEFDVVVNTLMLHHLPRVDRDAAMREMRRVLKPGGRVLCVDFGGAAKRGLVDRIHRRGSGVSPRKIEELVHTAALEVIESGPAGVLELQFVLARR
jgi:ubiquinone/menaquinone biosynthesis C-methylase UbiE